VATWLGGGWVGAGGIGAKRNEEIAFASVLSDEEPHDRIHQHYLVLSLAATRPNVSASEEIVNRPDRSTSVNIARQGRSYLGDAYMRIGHRWRMWL
jgi:hypothetical protein